MSAYGALSRPAHASPLRLPTTVWSHPRDPQTLLTLFHIDPSILVDGPGTTLFDYLHAVFADEVDKGLTYPQEDMRDLDAFKAYFFAADVVIAIVRSPEERVTASAPASESTDGEWERRVVPREVEVDLERARAGRTWDECLVGFYYVRDRPCLRLLPRWQAVACRASEPVWFRRSNSLLAMPTGCQGLFGTQTKPSILVQSSSLILRVLSTFLPLGETQLSRTFFACESHSPKQRHPFIKKGGIVCALEKRYVPSRTIYSNPHSSFFISLTRDLDAGANEGETLVPIARSLTDHITPTSHPLCCFFHSRSATRALSSRRLTETAATAASSHGRICITHPDWGTRQACSTWCMSTTWRAFGKRWRFPRLSPSCSRARSSSLTHTHSLRVRACCGPDWTESPLL